MRGRVSLARVTEGEPPVEMGCRHGEVSVAPGRSGALFTEGLGCLGHAPHRWLLRNSRKKRVRSGRDQQEEVSSLSSHDTGWRDLDTRFKGNF